MAYQSVNPANGEILRAFDQHTDAQMQSALGKADETYRCIWSRMAICDRARVVGRAASLMMERKHLVAVPIHYSDNRGSVIYLDRVRWDVRWRREARSSSCPLGRYCCR